MADRDLISLLNTHIDGQFNEDLSYSELHNKLSKYVNDLIVNDFSKLVAILYRVDVDEEKLKKILREEDSDAADIIARLILERELEKANTRKKFKG